MEKTILVATLFSMAILLAGCSLWQKETTNQNANTNTATAKNQNVNQAAENWKNYSNQDNNFSLQYPATWTTQDGDIECASVYEFDTLKLIVFGVCWKDSVGGEQLSFSETYNKFKAGFTENAEINTETINNISMEIIKYSAIADNGIYTIYDETGTLALWQKDSKGFTLVDEGNKHQEDGTFDEILESIELE